jgi:hypothetical protein
MDDTLDVSIFGLQLEFKSLVCLQLFSSIKTSGFESEFYRKASYAVFAHKPDAACMLLISG